VKGRAPRCTVVGLAATVMVGLILWRLGFNVLGLLRSTGWAGLVAAGVLAGYVLDRATRRPLKDPDG
jgi:hypothetical protein